MPLLYYLHFDFNPINLRSPKVESVATFLDLRSDPTLGANAINVVLPNASNVGKVADRLRKIPEVDKVTTIARLRAGRSRSASCRRSAGWPGSCRRRLSAEDAARRRPRRRRSPR